MIKRLCVASLLTVTLASCATLQEFADRYGEPVHRPGRMHYGRLDVAPTDIDTAQVIMQPSYLSQAEYWSLAHTRFTQDRQGLASWLRTGQYDERYPQGPRAPHQRLPKNAYSNIKLRPFNQIEVNGPINVTVRPSKGPRKISVSGPRRTVRNMFAMVKNGRLILELRAGEFLPGMAEVKVDVNEVNYISFVGNGDLHMRYVRAPLLNAYLATSGHVKIDGHKIGLRKLALNGSGQIELSGISSKRLHIDSAGSDRVAITGVASLQELFFGGTTRLSMYWINSPHLTVHGDGQGYAKLAGHTDLLEAETYNYAKLDTKFLRAHRSFVKTYHVSEAHLQSVHDQNTLALDKSNIYFYNRSKFRNDNMADNGAVLDYMAMTRK